MRCKNTRTPPSSWLHFYLGKLHVFWSRLIIHSRVAIVAQSFMHAGRVVTNHSVRSIEMQTWATKLILINRVTQIPSNQGSLRFKIKRTLFDQLCLPPMCFKHVSNYLNLNSFLQFLAFKTRKLHVAKLVNGCRQKLRHTEK